MKRTSNSDQLNPRFKSGDKFRTPQGFNAIKDGIKKDTAVHERHDIAGSETDISHRKPSWLRVRIGSGPGFQTVKKTVRAHNLSTVCEESHCPNIGECWNNGTATIMLMGSVCTRACRFCSVDTGNPGGWLDPKEPDEAAESVRLMGLKYVVLTSVDRDDLIDGGAAHYATCIRAIKVINPSTGIEALTPDFQGNRTAIETLVRSGLDVFAQNLETVQRLTHPVRDPRASYQQTLDVLGYGKRQRASLLTKSSLMLGLGETDDEIQTAMDDLRAHEVDILTLGQYLRPTPNHLPIRRWVHPDEFALYREWGLARGFLEVASGPLVRSSYRADKMLDRNNLGLNQIPVKAI